MRKVTFQIKKAKIDGDVFYQVTTPNPEGGRPKRKTFKSKADAETYLQSVKIQSENYGAAAFAISDKLRLDAIRATEILQGTGATLVDAARLFANRYRAEQSGVPLADAVAAYLRSRKIKNPVHLRTLRCRMENFVAAGEGFTTSTIGADDVTAFLDNLPHTAQTKKHYWTHLRSFFEFCVDRKWTPKNPISADNRPTVTQGEIEILTPTQSRKLLVSCDDQILAGVVIGMFCGLRQAEIEKLDWKAVDLVEGHIKLAAAQVKTRARRLVPIPENAQAWLRGLAKISGPIMSPATATRDLWTQSRVRAGFGPFKPTSSTVKTLQTDPKTRKPYKHFLPWPANALRHSAISYKLAVEQNLPKLAYEFGNSPDVIRSHYNGVATPKEAADFFSILPKESGNIIQMEAVA